MEFGSWRESFKRTESDQTGLATGGEFDTRCQLLMEKYGELLNTAPEITLIYLPGVDGIPVASSLPQIFWKPQGLACDAREIHIWMDGLYHIYLKEGTHRIKPIGNDHIGLKLLFNYSFWMLKPSWIYTIAFRMMESGALDEDGEEWVAAAAALAAMEGRNGLSDYLRSKARSAHPLFDIVYRIHRQRQVTVLPFILETSPFISFTMAAFRGDNLLEKRSIERWMEDMNKEEGEERSRLLWNLYGILTVRGEHRKSRRLLSSALKGGASHIAHRMLIDQYIIAGKPFHLMKLLSSLVAGDQTKLINTHDWYLATLMLHLRVEKQDQSSWFHLLWQLFETHFPGSLPESDMGEMWLEFLNGNTYRGYTVDTMILDLVACLKDTSGRHAQLLEKLTPVMRSLAIRRLNVDGKLFRRLTPHSLAGITMLSLAGPVPSFRIEPGLYYARHTDEREKSGERFLSRSARFNPAVIMNLSECLMNAGRVEEAISLYRPLIRRTEEVEEIREGYAQLLERSGRRSEALMIRGNLLIR